jgi:aminotransferase
MNALASAIGLEQLRQLPQFIARRRAIHDAYERAFGTLGWLRTPPAPPAEVDSSYYLYWVQLDPALRDRLASTLREEKIYTTFRYHPLHRVKRYASRAALPHAEAAARSTLCLPLHHGLSDEDVSRVIEAVVRFGASSA